MYDSNRYVESQRTYFTTGATFLFLAGNHSLSTTIQLINSINTTFDGIESNATILYGNHDAVLCVNVTNFQIQQLIFVCNTPSEGNRSSALVIFQSRSVSISNAIFKGSGIDNVTTMFGSLRIESNSEVAIVNSHFYSNSAVQGGGISLNESNITLDGSTFIANKARLGGAIYAELSQITLKETNGNTFADNVAADSGGAIYCKRCIINIVASRNSRSKEASVVDGIFLLEPQHIYFVNNSANWSGGAVALIQGSVLSSDASFLHFVENRIRFFGGAISAQIGISITLGKTREGTTQYFTGNEGAYGGAVYYFQSGGSLTMNGNTFFTNNSADNGGVLNAVLGGNVIMNGRTVFNGNYARGGGGAVHSFQTPIVFAGDLVDFRNCSSERLGGAVFQFQSLLVIHTIESNFINNSAHTGGGVSSNVKARFIAVSSQLTFSGNSALLGGAIQSTKSTENRVSSAVFIMNSGGAIFINQEENVIYHNITAIGNLGSAMVIKESRVNISGYTVFSKNLEGGIYAMNSVVSLLDYTEFKRNMAKSGAAIFSKRSQVYLHGDNIFEQNTASNGGAIFLFESTITLIGTANFTSNSAQRGGAMFFYLSATLNLEPNSSLITSHNYASEFGGAIYHRDVVNIEQCEFNMNFTTIDLLNISIDPLSTFFPQCFINLKELSADVVLTIYTIISKNDSARINGNFLYGGQLDRCQIMAPIIPIISYELFQSLIRIESTSTNITDISSKPYQLCFCECDQILSPCQAEQTIEIYRGQRFTLPLQAYGQGRSPVSTQVTAIIKKTASLNLNQSLQTLSQQCSDTTYNLYSTETFETLTLYVDGPCRDTGVATAVVNVILRPCPDTFNQSGDRCVCEVRLQAFDAECIIHSEEKIFIQRRTANSALFWISTLYANGSYQGLVLYGTCPPEYCRTEPVEILLDDLDSQCNHHRSGMLCGACADNYSLVLGSSRCQICSNHYLSLLLVFAAAGIVLVVFLTLLRLTVATGMINSIILYANILQVNKTVFFSDTTNALTVYIAWMNLDFGFPVCFYNGMDAYVQTWLQFAFPLYIWVIISLIILLSRYSITVSRLIGHNPIAVLATLILMAYTKVLKIIIEVYSFVELDYPESRRSTVWLKDANVPYFQNKHLFLTVLTSLILVFLFIPYTAILLIGYKVYRFTGRKQFKWLLKVKPLLDSYYAPYTLSTRYWTGFLLLVRCALYIIFSFNSLGGTSKSLLAIILTFSAIVVVANVWLSIKIYKHIINNIIEASIYMNLIILSAASLADVNTSNLTYFFVGVVFASTIGIVAYHFHISYTAKSTTWLLIHQKFQELKEWIRARRAKPLPPTTSDAAPVSSHDAHKMVTFSVMSLRESLLEES